MFDAAGRRIIASRISSTPLRMRDRRLDEIAHQVRGP
jgi:hypothetical protein